MELADYKIIFKGEIQSGFELEKVKKDSAKLFKLDEEQLLQIFSGSIVTLKKDITYEQAQEYNDILKSLGLQVYIEENSVGNNVFENGQEESTTYSSATATEVNQTAYHQEEDSDAHANSVTLPPAIWGSSFSGRYDRFTFFMAILFVHVVMLLGVGLAFLIAFTFFEGFARISAGIIISLLFFLICLFYLMRVIVLRLHDLDQVGWWVCLLILCFAHYIGVIFYIVFIIYLIFTPGIKGENRFGLQTKHDISL